VEVLFVGAILYDVLLPSFIAGIISYQISSALGVTYFHHTISFVPVFSELFFLKVVGAGIFFGICSVILIESLKIGEKLSERLRIWKPAKGLIGGAILVGLTLLIPGNFLGLGLSTIESCLSGEAVPWYAFLAKPLFTSVTLNFGGSGGIVTPIFFVGATAGALFAMVLSLNIATFSAIGLTSLLAGSANTPIAASIMAVELFGPSIAPYSTVACVISFLMTGHRSVYPSQILSIKKSSSLQVELGQEMENIRASYKLREKGILRRVVLLVEKLDRLLRSKSDD